MAVQDGRNNNDNLEMKAPPSKEGKHILIISIKFRYDLAPPMPKSGWSKGMRRRGGAALRQGQPKAFSQEMGAPWLVL